MATVGAAAAALPSTLTAALVAVLAEAVEVEVMGWRAAAVVVAGGLPTATAGHRREREQLFPVDLVVRMYRKR